MRKLPRKKKRKTNSLTKRLHNRAWKLMSECVRKGEKGICFTCGKHDEWKNTHAGHYIHNKLDFDFMNIHCQCTHCNTYSGGNSGIYAERLFLEYGEDAVISLRQRSEQKIKYSVLELEQIITDLKTKLKVLPEMI